MALKPSIPALTPQGLLEALRRYDPDHADDARPKSTPGKLLTVTETADRLGCSVRTVWTLIAQGELPKKMLGSRCARIPECAVVAFAEDLTGEKPNLREMTNRRSRNVQNGDDYGNNNAERSTTKESQ